jgi:hypothetical protein
MQKKSRSLSGLVENYKKIIKESLNSNIKDFEDAIQLNAALSNKKIQGIVTCDPRGFKNKHIAVHTPEEALDMIENTGR